MLATVIAGRYLPRTRIRNHFVRRLALAWRRPGHPWEVATITTGLVLWPYFTGARLIAPWVNHTTTTHYHPGFMLVIDALLVATFILCLALRSRSSTPDRKTLNGMAILSLVFGLFEYLILLSPIGMVRE